MLYGVKQLHGYKLHETNGEIGDVREVYFDDQKWCARYFVVETGNWLFGRKVLISPVAITSIDSTNAVMSVNLTREQVKHSPDISTDAPISRLMEARLSEHYGWPQYWGVNYAISPVGRYSPGVLSMAPFADQAPAAIKREQNYEAIEDQHILESHLRSSREVTGYDVAAQDGDIGHVDDFILDDVNWSTRYMVVDAGSWLPDRRMLLPTELIESISWEDACVTVNLHDASLKNYPPYVTSQPITREYEKLLFAGFHLPAYWETTPEPQHPASSMATKVPVDVTPQIAERAYRLYEKRGRQDGQADQDWARAEQDIRTEVPHK